MSDSTTHQPGIDHRSRVATITIEAAAIATCCAAMALPVLAAAGHSAVLAALVYATSLLGVLRAHQAWLLSAARVRFNPVLL